MRHTFFNPTSPCQITTIAGQLIKHTPDDPESNHIRDKTKRMISNPRVEPDALQNQLIDLLYVNFDLLGITPPTNSNDITRCLGQIESITTTTSPGRHDALLKVFDLVSKYLFTEKETTIPSPLTA
ncbi:MAG: hypothetical protein P1U63_08285 [Coxiellaceae bacterium]|nr:hypothetical protein [Coxiellaceae bacterium]